MLTVLGCTVASFAFAFDDDLFSPAEAGIAYPCPEGVKKVRFFDVLGAGCTIRAVFADGVCMDARYGAGILAAMAVSLAAIDLDTTSINGSVGTGNGRLSDILAELQGPQVVFGWGTYATLLATASVVMAARAARIMCSFQADGENVDYIYIGYDNTVTNLNWAYKLTGGQGYTIECGRHPIWAYSPTINQYLGWTDV